ncbi:polysaccharide pyruvyl transferase [Catenovulum agarivorans DS-2]|uniref:Polysaccharide pyruvyl transferase n=1 Tax=Catenovulum agarivorans DS-2 TaxID=1328313 RepID=W7QBP4_9ALTE|nr:polysaccharide pyruvyl transferase family protein [Catenovulum agarivorans]EWH09416.1 polysaccharide pyruvyl transferase [Catenovulum agarivorans DS-2]
MKIVILNVKYSPNLGDGAIAECLEMQIASSVINSQVSSIDIGGMEDYGVGGSIVSQKLSLTRLLDCLPDKLSSWVKTYTMPTLVSLKYGKIWREKLQNCDAIIIGGGHLFMDIDNYFPSRLMTAVKSAPVGVKIYVHAVGVSQRWTKRGRKFFERAFSHGELSGVSVRDAQSLENWKEVFPFIPAEICRDPAILASELYIDHKQVVKRRGKHVVGLGIADMENMKQHADQDTKVICGNFESYITIIEKLSKANFDIVLFTNGGDDVYLTKLANFIKLKHQELYSVLSIAPKPNKPVELVNLIRSFDAVIAHRLHANILAYSFAVPSIGLGWDRKLESFMHAAGREEFLVKSDNEASNILSMLEMIFSNKHNFSDQVRLEAQAGANRLAASLSTHGDIL